MKRLVTIIMLLLLLPAASEARLLWSADNGAVVVDQALLADVLAKGARQFRLPLDGREYVIKVDEVSEPNLGVTSLRGRFDGNPESFFLLCRTDNGATIAFFQPGDGTAYRLDHTRGRDEVYAVDYEALGSCAAALDSKAIRGGKQVSHPVPVVPLTDPGKLGDVADDGSRHDILVGYTPAAEVVMGGWDFIRAEAQLAIDAANLAYTNSNIASELRLVHVMFTDYQEISAWSYENHVEFLWYPDDGKMDDMLVMRDRVGADFVTVLIDGRDTLGDVPTCGVAPIMQADQFNSGFEDLALSVVSVQCATDNWSLAHEVGHNRGCAHNRENASLDGAFSYAYGRRFVGTNDGWYRTVMAYDHFEGGYERVPYFTNPDVDYAGVPTGVTVGLQGEAHNALAHDTTAAVCAAFRGERTFVQFGWFEFSNGFILFPYPSIAQAVFSSRVNGTIVIQNDKPSFLGVLGDPRLYVHDGTGSAVLGGN